MRLINIPYSPVNLFIFSGEKERNKFDSKVRFQHKEWEGSKDSDGMHFMNHIFIEDIKDREIILHELSHFLEWLYDYMEIKEEHEFKACMFSHIINEVIK